MTGRAAVINEFEAEYFARYYRDYKAQNPTRKLDFYLETIERFQRPTSLLDVGCGLGSFLEHVASRRNFQLAGTDVSEFGLSQNQQRMPSVEFRRASAEECAFPANHFDVITAFDVIEHVPDLAKVADAVHQMLRPGGVFCVVVPVYDGLSGPIIQWLDKDPTHVHKWPRRRWLDWASKTGFSVEHWVGMLRYLLPVGYYLHVPTMLMRWHVPAILMVLRR